MADACDSNTLDVCDPNSDDPATQPPMAVQGAHPMEVEFEPVVVVGLTVEQSRLRFDRRTGAATSRITVTNNTGTPIIGQLRAVISANKPVLDVDGVTAGGDPFITLLPNNNSILGVGASVSGVVSFGRSRPTPSYTTVLELKSVTPP